MFLKTFLWDNGLFFQKLTLQRKCLYCILVCTHKNSDDQECLPWQRDHSTFSTYQVFFFRRFSASFRLTSTNLTLGAAGKVWVLQDHHGNTTLQSLRFQRGWLMTLCSTMFYILIRAKSHLHTHRLGSNCKDLQLSWWILMEPFCCKLLHYLALRLVRPWESRLSQGPKAKCILRWRFWKSSPCSKGIALLFAIEVKSNSLSFLLSGVSAAQTKQQKPFKKKFPFMSLLTNDLCLYLWFWALQNGSLLALNSQRIP